MTNPDHKPGVVGRVGLFLIKGYQIVLSPVFFTLGVRCRHEPSCSVYTADAIRSQGLWRGVWLGLGRIGRCRPGGTHGFDPAPETPTDAPWWTVWAFRPSTKPLDTLHD